MTITEVMRIHLASIHAGHCDFEDTLALVDRYFDYTPCGFHNGPLYNPPGENEGSCRLLALAQHCNLTEAETLNCFGRHYRQVLEDPAGSDHGNIRQFIGTGWSGVRFTAMALRLRPRDDSDTLAQETTI